MKKYQIFIGDIRVCTKYDRCASFVSGAYINGECIGSDYIGYINKDDELYKKDAILVKIKNRGYVDLEKLSSILDNIEIFLESRRRGFNEGDIAITTFPYEKGDLFVDETTLRPYFSDELRSDISVRQLKNLTIVTK